MERFSESVFKLKVLEWQMHVNGGRVTRRASNLGSGCTMVGLECQDEQHTFYYELCKEPVEGLYYFGMS